VTRGYSACAMQILPIKMEIYGIWTTVLLVLSVYDIETALNAQKFDINIFWTVKDSNFTFGSHIQHNKYLPQYDKIPLKWEWSGLRDRILKFWDPSITNWWSYALQILYSNRCKISHKRAWLGSRDPFWNFGTPVYKTEISYLVYILTTTRISHRTPNYPLK